VPLIAANGPVLDLTRHQWAAFLPPYVAYYAGHLAGGFASVLRLPRPRF
jgi:hypothetical protein